MQQSKQANPFVRNHLIRDGISRAIFEEMQKDPSIYLFGEGAEVKQYYDAPYILETFPDRVITMPISEDGSTNFAIGASLLGVTPIIDVITADFLYRTMDSICNTAAKLNFVAPDNPKTIVIRSEFLLAGPTTGQRPEALFAHIPGLNVVIPSTPRDAYGLMRTALNTPGVTIFFEDRMIQDALLSEPDCRMDSPIGFGFALLRNTGGPKPILTIVTYGLMRQAVETVCPTDHLSNLVDLIDLRTIYPIDWTEIKASVRKSGKLLIIEPDVQYGGVGAEIAATVAEWNVAPMLHIVSDGPSLLSEGDPFKSGAEIRLLDGERLEILNPQVQIKRLGGVRETAPAKPGGLARMMPTESEIIDVISSF